MAGNELPPLAGRADVEASLGRPLSEDEAARVDAILAKLSDLFRRESGQTFTPGRSRVRRKVNGGEAFLPQRPIARVISVVDERGRPVNYSLVGQWLLVPSLASDQFVTVEYEHGSETVPPLVVETVADAARQVLQLAPEAVSGVSQVSQAGNGYTASASYAAWAQGGATRLSPEDARIARSYRQKLGNVWATGG